MILRERLCEIPAAFLIPPLISIIHLGQHSGHSLGNHPTKDFQTLFICFLIEGLISDERSCFVIYRLSYRFAESVRGDTVVARNESFTQILD